MRKDELAHENAVQCPGLDTARDLVAFARMNTIRNWFDCSGRRKPSLLGSVQAPSQNWGGLTGQSGAGVHVGDLHDPQTAPIRFHADLHAGSGWDRNIACTPEDREVEKRIRNRAVQRHEAELPVEAEPTYPRGPDHRLTSPALNVRQAASRKWR